MNINDLTKRLLLLKANPKLAEMLPQAEILAMMTDVLTAITQLKKTIEENKLRGEKGETGSPGAPGFTPRPEIDYPTNKQFKEALKAFESQFKALDKTIKAKLADVQNGKDAQITPELIAEVAELAKSRIELPDVALLVAVETDAFWSALDILEEDLEKLKEEIKNQPRGSSMGTSKNVINAVFDQRLPVSVDPPINPKVNQLWVQIL